MNNTFDYLILGGGSAGSVLAARLSEDGATRVALVETGGDGRDFLIRTPAGAVAMLPTKINNYGYETVPQPGLNGRRGYQPRGRGLGGSSAINAMVYVRGHRADYDQWAALGNPGWSYDEVLPFFKRAENNERLCDDYHGRGGPLNVADLRSGNPFQQHFLDAVRQAGFPLNSDFNGAEQEGLGVYQVTQINGERCSAARAYLHPLLSDTGRRLNLEVITGATAERILFDGRRATGASIRYRGELINFTATREVIVCGGAINSPQLLMLSGIGDAAQLRQHGIEPVHHLPGVGQNLQDHPDFIFGFASPSTELIGFTPSGLVRMLGEMWRYGWRRRGMLTTNFAECGGFLKLSPASPTPDIQLHFVVALVEDHARKLNYRHGFSCHVCLLRPKSRGSIRLASSRAADAPLIDPAFLQHEDDLEQMVQAFRLTRKLLRAPALTAHASKEMFTAGIETDDDIRRVLRERAVG